MVTLDNILKELKDKFKTTVKYQDVKDYGGENSDGNVWIELKSGSTIYIENDQLTIG